MSTSSPVVQLYRAMLRTSAVYDTNCILKALIVSPTVTTVSDVSDSSGTALLTRVMDDYREAFLQGKPFYRVESDGWTPTPSMKETVKACFRDEELATKHGRLLCQDAGYVLLNQLTEAVKTVQQMIDYEEIRLPDIGDLEGELEHVKSITPGTLLLDHPAVMEPGRAVILVYDLAQNVPEVHGNDKWIMRGWVVNRPLPTSAANAFPHASAMLGSLSSSPLFMGGMHPGSTRELSLLHRFENIGGAVPIGESGLYCGGAAGDAVRMVESGEARLEDFKLLSGFEQWEVDMEAQSMAGIDRYIFARGSLTKGLALVPGMFGLDPDGLISPSPLPDEDEELDESGNMTLSYPHNRFFHQNVIWAQAVRSLGGEFEPLSALHPMISEQVLLDVFGTPTAELGDEDDNDPSAGVVEVEVRDTTKEK